VISFDSIGPFNGDSIVICVLFIYIIIKKDSSGRGVQHYVIKFVSDLRQVGGFLRVLWFPPPCNKIDSNDIAEILLKVVLNTIKLNQILYIVSYLLKFYVSEIHR